MTNEGRQLFPFIIDCFKFFWHVEFELNQTGCHTRSSQLFFCNKNHLGPSAFVPVAVSFLTNTVLICFCWRMRPTTILLIVPGVDCHHPCCCHISLLGTEIFSMFSVTKDVNVSLQPTQPTLPVSVPVVTVRTTPMSQSSQLRAQFNNRTQQQT